MSSEADNKVGMYIVQVMTGRENKVFTSLDFLCGQDAENRVEVEPEKQRKLRSLFNGRVNGIYELNVPVEKIEERDKKNQKVQIERKLYPGYVFIRVRLYDDDGKLIPENWSFIRQTNGVIGFLGDPHPVQLRPDEEPKEEADKKPVPREQFLVGERVIIKDGGALTGYDGVVVSVDNERGDIAVSANIFNRGETIVRLQTRQVSHPEE